MLKSVFRRMLSVLFLVLVVQVVTAQDSAPGVTLANEHKIGVDCPNATAVQPGTDTVWVLMNSCYGAAFTLVAYDMKTGELLNQPPVTIASEDDPNVYITWYANALGFRPDGKLELIMSDGETYAQHRVQIDVATGEITSDADADANLNALIAQYTDYSDAIVYSPNHATGVVTEEKKLFVLDIDANTMLFEIDANTAFPNYSPDSARLYVTVMDDPEDYDKTSGTLNIYSLPDGAQVSSQHFDYVSSSILPAPDGRYAVLLTNDNQLGILDLSTGTLSSLLNVYEEPQRVTKCANDGRDMTDYDYRTSGNLLIMGLNWLSDSSGFVTLNSNTGEATSDNCVLDFSRLRQYSVTGA